MAHKIKRRLLAKKQKQRWTKEDFLSTGSTLVDLACSGRLAGGIPKGIYAHLIGDSDTGKTWMTMAMLAEATMKKSFKDYRLIHDNPEGGALMNLSEFFNDELEERLEDPPRGTSEFVEDFYFNLDQCYEDDRPFIYICDSMDAMHSRKDLQHDRNARKAADRGKEAGGTYGTEKAKANSRGLRKAKATLKKNGSILVIVSQTRDNIGFGGQFNPKTRSGGTALKFYNRLEIWTSPLKEIKTKVRDKDRQQGILVKVKVKKNHINGRRGTVEIPIYHSFGIDDVGSMVDYLVSEGQWKKKKGGIEATELDFSGTREKLIRHIDEEDLRSEVRKIVKQVWDEIVQATAIQRKKRY